jgi:thiol-disulfide isomerase/thioredoxin
MLNKILIVPLAIVIAGGLIAGAIIFGPKINIKTLSPQEAAGKAIDYINKNLLTEGLSASLLTVSEESGVYKIHIKVGENEYDSYVSRNGKLLFIEGIDIAEVQKAVEEMGKASGNFSVSSDEVCKENEKPIVYFFGSQSCPHCTWEHPIVEEVAGKFGDYISFHNNMDSEVDTEVFQKYSTGGIPTLVLGCKYYRVGSGEAAGEEQETKDLTSLICELTNNQPSKICQE